METPLSREERATGWIRTHVITTIIIVTSIWGVLILVSAGGIISSRTASFHAQRDATRAAAKADQLAHENHRLTVALCHDVNARVAARKRSDGAAGDAFAAQARQLYLALSAVPPRERTPQQLRFSWAIWAADRKAALRLADKGIGRTVTKC